METAKKFFEEIVMTEEAKALFAAAEAPKSEEDRVCAYIDIASKLGIALTVEGIAAYFQAVANQEPAEGELDDQELQQLVGGGANAACQDTYLHRENCWLTDGCDKVFEIYEGYTCHQSNYGVKQEACYNNMTHSMGKRYG